MAVRSETWRSPATSALGLVALVAVWWIGTLTFLSGLRIPSPAGVVASALDDGWGYYSLHFGMTLQEAAVGFLYGTAAAIVLASVVLLVPAAEPIIMQVAVISYCIPLVAIAPVLFIVIGNPDEGQRSGTATALAAMSVFFTTVVGTVLGLRSADRTSLDVVSVFGGGRFRQLQKVQLVSALPAIIAALRIGAPAAFLGAILGEYVGGVQRGVAVTLKIAQQNVDVEQAWAIGLGCAVVAGAAYAAFGMLARVVTPWSRGAELVSAPLLTPGAVDTTAGPTSSGTPRSAGAALVRSVLRAVATMVLVLVVVVLGWIAALRVFDVSDYVGKGPGDVWTTLFGEGEDSAELRGEIRTLLLRTLADAGIGFVAGMLVAMVLAFVVVRYRTWESAVMPVALILQTVPLIALAPILILLVGRGFAIVAIMSAIVVLFPALVNLVLGLRSVTPQLRDVVLVYGGSPSTVLLRVAFPSALPALFASIRIAVPGAMTGALLAEWLATGKGIGYAVVSAAGRSQNSRVWALVVVITLTSLLLYLVAQLVEAVVLSRFGRDAGRL